MASHPNKKSDPKTITMARVPRGWPKSSSFEELADRGSSIGFPDMSAVRSARMLLQKGGASKHHLSANSSKCGDFHKPEYNFLGIYIIG